MFLLKSTGGSFLPFNAFDGVWKSVCRILTPVGRFFLHTSGVCPIFASESMTRKQLSNTFNMYMNRLLLRMMLPLMLLVVGGCTEDDEYTQGQWMKRSGFEAAPRAYACSFTIGDKGYLCGGFRGANKEYMNDLWVYDMNTNNWEQLADMPTG